MDAGPFRCLPSAPSIQSMSTTERRPNPFLSGNLAPVDTETTAFDLPVTGTLPAELDGRYLQIGRAHV